MGQAAGLGAGLDDDAVESRGATMAAQSRGSVKVFVQPLKDSLEAMATLFLAFGQDLEQQFRAATVELSFSSASVATLGTGTKWLRWKYPICPSTPPFSCAPSMPGRQ